MIVLIGSWRPNVNYHCHDSKQLKHNAISCQPGATQARGLNKTPLCLPKVLLVVLGGVAPQTVAGDED